MFRITKDFSFTEGTAGTAVGTEVKSMPLYGLERAMGEDDSIPNEGDTVKFRLWDDDGELLYEGELTDDEDCNNQIAALRWGETDSGATILKVKRGNAWVQEIS